jgi:hypothetical protein
MKNKPHSFLNPLTLTGFLFVLIAFLSVSFSLYFIYLAAFFLATGILAIWLSWPIRVYAKGKMYVILQYGISMLILGGWGLSYLSWTATTVFTLPKNHPDSILLVYGIEDYPDLPTAFFWRRTIEVPENGIIVTSDKEPEKRLKLKDHLGNTLSYSSYDWQANNWYPCVLTNNTIHYWVISFGDINDYPADTLRKLANKINTGELKSDYKDDSPITTHNSKTSLNLQGKNLPSLPDGIASKPIHYAYLTGNRFTEIPRQVLELDSLEMLYLSHNKISWINPKIGELKNLHYLSLNGNPLSPSDTMAIKKLLPNCKITFN